MLKHNHPKVLITGGLDGIGRDLVNIYKSKAKGISRRNGYNINFERQKIVKLARQYDVFVNLANSEFSQAMLLYDIFSDWEASNKPGYIINIGSYGTYNPGDSWRAWLASKYALDIANKQCCKKIEEKNLSFRTTNVRLGMLDTKKSRQKDNWEGIGHKAKEISEIINYLWVQYQKGGSHAYNEITVNNIKNL
jgi:NAD(P)-dependent dehydrogenase (short-subunit alcohol dehydrogenase family)